MQRSKYTSSIACPHPSNKFSNLAFRPKVSQEDSYPRIFYKLDGIEEKNVDVERGSPQVLNQRDSDSHFSINSPSSILDPALQKFNWIQVEENTLWKWIARLYFQE